MGSSTAILCCSRGRRPRQFALFGELELIVRLRARAVERLANEFSFFENAALVVAQDLSDATEFINETCDSGIGSTHHRAPIFYASKNGISQMLTRTG